MSRTYRLALICFSFIALTSLATTSSRAGLVTVADYKFAGNGADSSGNGYTLTNNAGTSGPVTFGTDPIQGTYASFSGGDYLSTSKALALNGASEVVVTYSVQGTATGEGIILETSTNYFNNPGAFAFTDNPGGLAQADVETINGNVGATFPSSALNAWETFQVVYNMAATGTPGDAQVTVSQLVGSIFVPVGDSGVNLIPDVFNNFDAFIGARSGGTVNFTGNIAELKIQALGLAAATPEPSSLVLLGLGAAAMIASAARRFRRARI